MMMQRAMATAATALDKLPKGLLPDAVKEFIAANKEVQNESGMEGQTIDAPSPITGLIDTQNEKKFLAESMLEKIKENPNQLIRLQRAIRMGKGNEVKVNQFIDKKVSGSSGEQKVFEILPQFKTALLDMPILNPGRAAETASN